MSAPLPCCSITNVMMDKETMICTTSKKENIMYTA
jgi:hypothetical protein